MATRRPSAVLEPEVVVADNPVDELQLSQLRVEWVPRDTLRPNKYNPNRMTSMDRALLRQSILEDGWTQPIVTLLDGTIVDGEQRWTVSGGPCSSADVQAILEKMALRQAEGYVTSASITGRLERAVQRLEALEAQGIRPTLADMTSQLVPITRVDFKDDAHKMIATIRHNRARGTHVLDAMAEITQDLAKMGLDMDDLQARLGMQPDEVERLMEIAPLSDIPDDTALSTAWAPVAVSTLPTEQLLANDQAELARARSEAASAGAKAHQVALAQHEQLVRQQTEARIREAEAARGQGLTQTDKVKIREDVQQAVPAPTPLPAPETLQKFVFFVTMDEFAICQAVLGDPPVKGFLDLCRAAYEAQDLAHVAATP